MKAQIRSRKLLHGNLSDTYQQIAQIRLLVTSIGTLSTRVLGTRLLGIN
jgi:hypothetical protein